MSDRELLELAAKAHGNIRKIDGCDSLMNDDNGQWWNPLDDDGDALRLAVKLRMSVEVATRAAIAWFRPGPDACLIDCTEEVGDDADAATRRAIVLAAAEIGRSMSNG